MTYSTRSELLNLVPASHCQVNINSLYIIPIIAVHSIHQELAPYAKQYTPWMILIYGYSLYSLVANAMPSRQVSQRSRTTTTQVPLATEVYPFHRPLWLLSSPSRRTSFSLSAPQLSYHSSRESHKGLQWQSYHSSLHRCTLLQRSLVVWCPQMHSQISKHPSSSLAQQIGFSCWSGRLGVMICTVAMSMNNLSDADLTDLMMDKVQRWRQGGFSSRFLCLKMISQSAMNSRKEQTSISIEHYFSCDQTPPRVA